MVNKDRILVFRNIGTESTLGKTKDPCKAWIEKTDDTYPCYNIHRINIITKQETVFRGLPISEINRFINSVGDRGVERDRFPNSKIDPEKQERIIKSFKSLNDYLVSVAKEKFNGILDYYTDQGIPKDTVKRIVWENSEVPTLGDILEVKI